MSKYGKHLRDKEYRKQVRNTNKELANKKKNIIPIIDNRSNRKTFDKWCEECCDTELYEFYGVLSIAGSDGIPISDTKLNKTEFNNISGIDFELESNGYYDDATVNMGSYNYKKPKMKYSTWFNQTIL